MFSILSNVGPEIPFTLVLLALLGLRAGVRPRASLHIKARPEAVFALIDLFDGKQENWGHSRVTTRCLDAAAGLYRRSYSHVTGGIESRETNAIFRIVERNAPAHLLLRREGLQGRPTDNELLEQEFRVVAENGGARLSLAYHWGPRALLSQLTARADLWGGIYRLKGMAENGRPDERPYQIISAAVAAATGLLAVAAFALVLGWIAAGFLVFALFFHEYGHLLAYRLMGQPWGRMIFLPFLGAIAMPRLPFSSQGQAVFAALMGPGFSVLLAMACAIPSLTSSNWHVPVTVLGLVTSGLNIFNLLPVEPLDGGIALRSVLSRLMGPKARFGLIAIGAMIVATGLLISQIILVIFGGIAILANLRRREIDTGLAPLSNLQLAIGLACYAGMISAYITLLGYFASMIAMPAA